MKDVLFHILGSYTLTEHLQNYEASHESNETIREQGKALCNMCHQYNKQQ